MKLNLPNTDAYLMVSESAHNANMYYATGFLAVDSFVYLNAKKETLLVSDMELGRAGKESRIKDVLTTSKYGMMEKLRKHKDVDAAYCEMIIEIPAFRECKTHRRALQFSCAAGRLHQEGRIVCCPG